MHLRYFWQGNYRLYGHIRCMHYMYDSVQPYKYHKFLNHRKSRTKVNGGQEVGVTWIAVPDA